MFDFLLSTPALLLVLPFVLGATTEGGVLGKTRGKVGNVVFSTWKGINTIRAFTEPANPQTTAQQDNRGDFGDIASIASDLNKPLLQPYWDWLDSQMSGFNSFVKRNMPGQNENLSSTALTVAVGNLPQLEGVGAAAGAGAGDVTVSWSAPGSPHDSMTVKIVRIAQDYSEAQLIDPGATGADGTADVSGRDQSAAYYPVLIDDSASAVADSIGDASDGALHEI